MKVSDTGSNNKIDIHSSVQIDTASSINMKGNNNRIIVKRNTVLKGAHFVIESDNNIVEIGEECRITGRYIQKLVDGNCIEVGDRTTFGIVHIICGEGRKVTIGSDCMLAFDITLRTTDSHEIFDRQTNDRVNPAQDIIIEDHVWIAAEVTVLKGSVIKKDSVVAIKSLVTTNFKDESVVIGGVPGKVIKEGINWKRPLLG